MIYPTRRAVLAASAAAPAALLIGVFAPAYSAAGLALLALLVALAAVDALAGASARDAAVEAEGPGAVAVGEDIEIALRLGFRRRAPSSAEVALAAEGPLETPIAPRRRLRLSGDEGAAALPFQAVRRGTAEISEVWLRWRGPLGLVWKQKRMRLAQRLLVTPDLRPVHAAGARMHLRDAAHGMAAQLRIGEGAEFEALADYRQGMDRRAIDWKQSARHTALIAKEYRTERNNNIVLAIDSGRTMCEPAGGLPRVDRAVTAALLSAWVALKDGDRVGLFAFDSRPRVASKAISGSRSFALLQRLAASINYSAQETNYTLALSTLAAGLHRRSLVVVFTDFADTTGAELMLAAVGTLLKRHLVLFVMFRDEELEALAGADPHEPDDVSRAVTAAALLAERKLVLTRLRHLGVHVIEAPAQEAGPALVAAYLKMKRRNML